MSVHGMTKTAGLIDFGLRTTGFDFWYPIIREGQIHRSYHLTYSEQI